MQELPARICIVDTANQAHTFDRGRIVACLQGLAALEPVLAVEDSVVCDIAEQVATGCYDGVRLGQVVKLLTETVQSHCVDHPDYSILAARVMLHKQLYKTTPDTWLAYLQRLRGDTHQILGAALLEFATEHAEEIENALLPENDNRHNFFALSTLVKSYLLEDSAGVAERPQFLLMRVALYLHPQDLASALATYKDMSEGYYTHATPTLFNAGRIKGRSQVSSCYLLAMQNDSIEGIFETVKRCAEISKGAGGIGLHIHCVRAQGTAIGGSCGKSNGIVPMLRVFNATARYVDQGGGKRKGSFALYLEPWHADILQFLDLKKNHGTEENRTRDLFMAAWVPDLFMQRAEKNEMWTLMCPHECPGLDGVHGAEFTQLYESYEKAGKGRTAMRARELLEHIVLAMAESGSPYVLFKDACNRKSNHSHLGTIKCSNLCTEVVQYTRPTTATELGEIAVCNLASMALPKFVVDDSPGVEAPRFDYPGLHAKVKQVTRNLDNLIDLNDYPVPEAENSNTRHRPIGIGVQGLADVFIKFGCSYTSPLARELNRYIFETIYHAALEASWELAIERGAYSSFAGSPMSNGLFQFDLWAAEAGSNDNFEHSGMYDWDDLREKIMRDGVRNSLLTAPMPTASTSQILGNTESFEPITAPVISRRTLAGEFPVLHPIFVQRMVELGLWTKKIRREIMEACGSIADIQGIPHNIKSVFQTAYEIGMKGQIQMAADRGRYICQSQSFNWHFKRAETSKMIPCMFYAWKMGLKTGCYYLRQEMLGRAVQFGNVESPTTTTTTTSASTLSIGKPPQCDNECEVCSA